MPDSTAIEPAFAAARGEPLAPTAPAALAVLAVLATSAVFTVFTVFPVFKGFNRSSSFAGSAVLPDPIAIEPAFAAGLVELGAAATLADPAVFDRFNGSASSAGLPLAGSGRDAVCRARFAKGATLVRSTIRHI